MPLVWALAAYGLLGDVTRSLTAVAVGVVLILTATVTLARFAEPAGDPVPVSALLVAEDLAVWLVAVGLGVAVVEARVGWRPALVLVGAVHLGATVLSQGLLGLRVAVDAAPQSALHQLDVGPSYVVIAGLVGAAVLSRSRLGRVAALAALAVGIPELVEGQPRLDLAATGHVAAVLIAVPLARRLRPVSRPDPDRRSPCGQDLSGLGSPGK